MLDTEGQAPVSDEAQPVAAPEQDADLSSEATENTEEAKETQVEKTYTKQELQDALEKATAKAAAKAERRAERVYKEALAAAGLNRQTESPKQESMPQRANFASDEDWLNARDEFRDKQREAKVAQERQQEIAAKVQQKNSTLIAEAQKLGGFDMEDFEALPVTPVMADAIRDSEIGAKLVSHLVLNEGEAERISKLSPARQAAEIGKLEVKLSAVKSVKAPPPINPIGSGSSKTIYDPESASLDDYIKQRQKQGAVWSRR